MQIDVAIFETIDFEALSIEHDIFVTGGNPIFRFEAEYHERNKGEVKVCGFEIKSADNEFAGDEDFKRLENSCALVVSAEGRIWGAEFHDGKWVSSICPFRYMVESGGKALIRGEVLKSAKT